MTTYRRSDHEYDDRRVIHVDGDADLRVVLTASNPSIAPHSGQPQEVYTIEQGGDDDHNHRS